MDSRRPWHRNENKGVPTSLPPGSNQKEAIRIKRSLPSEIVPEATQKDHLRNVAPILTSCCQNQSRRGPPRNVLANSCILLPVFVAVWWYWTKRRAKTVISGLVQAASSQDDATTKDDRDYASWDEVVQQDARDPSVRFVRWFKRGSSEPSKRRSFGHSQSSRSAQSDESHLSSAFFETKTDSKGARIRAWECLKSAGEDGFELCSPQEASFESSTDDDLVWKNGSAA